MQLPMSLPITIFTPCSYSLLESTNLTNIPREKKPLLIFFYLFLVRIYRFFSIFWLASLAHSDVILHVFWNGMLQTRPGFLLMPGFYPNFSITGPKKISWQIFAMLSKTQPIFIIEHYLQSHYWTKMSDTFTFNRMEVVPIHQKKPWNFYTNFSMTGSFPLGYGLYEART